MAHCIYLLLTVVNLEQLPTRSIDKDGSLAALLQHKDVKKHGVNIEQDVRKLAYVPVRLCAQWLFLNKKGTAL